MTHPEGAYLPSIKERRTSVHAERLRNSVADWSSALAAVSDLPSAVRQDVVDALDLARRFNAEVVRPMALHIDRRAAEDPAYIPRELIQLASDWGLFTVWLPSLFGGKGWNFLSLYAFLEEVSTACVGVANVVGVHYMGVAMLTASWNMRLAHRIFSDVCEGERLREPRLISLAMNEAQAGSDVAETLLLNRARLQTQATLQPDGSYVLDGCKTMISNGHVSTWHMVVAYEDLARPADTLVVLAVHRDAPGLKLGLMAEKLGQRACVASDLHFDTCTVPAEQVALDRQLTKGMARPHQELAQTLLDYVVSCTRTGVGAFAAGTARGAHDAARDYAMRTLLPQGRLIEQQWAQTQLADMHKNASLARQAYVESALANGMGGLFRLMFYRPLYWADQLAPMPLWRAATRIVLRSKDAARFFQKRFLAAQPREWQNLVSGMASSAKVASSDLAMCNVGLALDLVGSDGLRHELGLEKRLRDAKVLQIYEGTNQINLVNLFKCRVRSDDSVAVFRRESDAP
ncbi:MAG: acyl-CoA dehydrogenase family protein [Aquabacterium sp.]